VAATSEPLLDRGEGQAPGCCNEFLTGVTLEKISQGEISWQCLNIVSKQQLGIIISSDDSAGAGWGGVIWSEPRNHPKVERRGEKRRKRPDFCRRREEGAHRGAAGLRAPPGPGVGGAWLRTFRGGLGDVAPSPRAPCDARGRSPAFPRQQPGSSHPPGRGGGAPARGRSAEGLYLAEKEERW